MNPFSNTTGTTDQTKEMLQRGAVIIDVRTPGEYQSGHVANSKNIPLDEVDARIEELRSFNKPLVLCCASGARSGNATSYLQAQGIDCHNGGSWVAVAQAV